jgi:hypothetical protein
MAAIKAPVLSPEEIRFAAGGGNWLRIAEAGVSLEGIFASASEWSDALKGVSLPWP